MSEKITAWSYSRYSVYQECPRKAFYKFVKKLKEPGSPAMDRGDTIHKSLESYLTGRSKAIPPEAKSLAKEYKTIKASKPQVELELAFTNKWEQVGWFDRNAWCRVKVDALIPPIIGKDTSVKVIDHKTGKLKEYGEYDEQLELYGVAGLIAYPTAEIAIAKLLFVDHGTEVPCDPFPRKDLKKLQKKWDIRVKPMLSDVKFKPTPGNACRWCHFSKSKGGDCEF